MSSLREVPLFARLARSERVLVAGAGGGFDVYSGLPIALALHAAGKRVHLANLSFTYLGATDAPTLAPFVHVVDADTSGSTQYFPERTLAQWLRSRGLPSEVHAFDKVGVQPLRASYQAIVDRHEIDAVVLVDGGTDLLVSGDEAGLGTPEEDAASLAAVAGLAVPVKLAACLGFGVDAYHGVCHAHFLENVAAVSRAGGYLGAFSIPPGSEEAELFLDAARHAKLHTPSRPSIVMGSIAAALEGSFGDVRFTERTADGELFVNPLMTVYFCFEVDVVARWSKLVPAIEGTTTIWEVAAAIGAVRQACDHRPRTAIPH